MRRSTWTFAVLEGALKGDELAISDGPTCLHMSSMELCLGLEQLAIFQGEALHVPSFFAFLRVRHHCLRCLRQNFSGNRSQVWCPVCQQLEAIAFRPVRLRLCTPRVLRQIELQPSAGATG